jgi:hypothetical protein
LEIFYSDMTVEQISRQTTDEYIHYLKLFLFIVYSRTQNTGIAIRKPFAYIEGKYFSEALFSKK